MHVYSVPQSNMLPIDYIVTLLIGKLTIPILQVMSLLVLDGKLEVQVKEGQVLKNQVFSQISMPKMHINKKTKEAKSCQNAKIVHLLIEVIWHPVLIFCMKRCKMLLLIILMQCLSLSTLIVVRFI